jgi:hypothetical protein
VLWSLWTTAVLCGCKCRGFIGFCGDDAGIHCAVCHATDFLGDVYNLTKISCFLKACILHVLSCLKLYLLLETNSLTCKLFSCVSVHPEVFILTKLVHAPSSNLHSSSSRCVTETLHNLQ